MSTTHGAIPEEDCSCGCRCDDLYCDCAGRSYEVNPPDPDDLILSEEGISSLLLIEAQDRTDLMVRQIDTLKTQNRRLRLLLKTVIKNVLEDPNVRTVMDGREMTGALEAIKTYCDR